MNNNLVPGNLRRATTAAMAAFACLASSLAWADEPTKSKDEVVKQTIGDKAAALDVSHWVKGDAVDVTSADGKSITIVEFWATWCGPCIASIPHLTEIQHEYAPKGVKIVSVSKMDENNTLKMVKDFVKDQGDKMDFTVAFDEKGIVSDQYMKAYGQSGIPTAFVVDQQGRIAWVGHPMGNMEEVLDQLLDGKYDLKTAQRKFEIDREFMAAWMARDYEKA
ncbi:MAG: TlpA family protein disulfide reductase, partial [Planctomycetota bacterium]